MNREEKITTIKNINKKILELLKKARELGICYVCDNIIYGDNEERYSCLHARHPAYEKFTINFKIIPEKIKKLKGVN